MFNRDVFGKQLSIWLNNSICPTPDTSSPLILFSQQLSSSQPCCSNKKQTTGSNFLQPPSCLEWANTRTMYLQCCWCESSLHPLSHTVPSPCSVARLFPVSTACAWNALYVQKKYFQMESGTRICLIWTLTVQTHCPWPIRIGIHPPPLVLIINYNTIMILHGIFWLYAQMFRKLPVLQLDWPSWCEQSLNQSVRVTYSDFCSPKDFIS